MSFSPELADIRFGCGLSPVVRPVASVDAMLTALAGPDTWAARFPIATFTEFRERLVAVGKLRRKALKDKQNKDLKANLKAMSKDAARARDRWYRNTLLRSTYTDQALRERLVGFWADHFTAIGKTSILPVAMSTYIEEAIRPNITGTFADMLIATTTHPLMLHFLDQNFSVGPNSITVKKKKKKRLQGLNENLAREVMELHTLGVDGPYSQDDVRQLAELFTGMTFNGKTGFMFRRDYAEPGPETVMGRTYGGNPASLDPVLESLRDLAVHPVTARHIAWKLAVHFVADMPDPDLVDHVTARYEATGGDLMAVYAALLEHPAAWDATLHNVKPPADFVASTVRALAVDQMFLSELPEKKIRRWLMRPQTLMGQPYQLPGGPDGWPEEDDEWITPPALSARMRWAFAAPQALRPDLPDPRVFVDQALGPYADKTVRFAADAAESKPDAIGLILSSPAFQRR